MKFPQLSIKYLEVSFALSYFSKKITKKKKNPNYFSLSLNEDNFPIQTRDYRGRREGGDNGEGRVGPICQMRGLILA